MGRLALTGAIIQSISDKINIQIKYMFVSMQEAQAQFRLASIISRKKDPLDGVERIC